MRKRLRVFYGTFGQAHAYPNHYIKVIASTTAKARALMFGRFGDKWAFLYQSLDELHPQDRKYKVQFDLVEQIFNNTPTKQLLKGADNDEPSQTQGNP